MKTLFIITSIKKPSLLDPDSFELVQGSQQMYETYQEAENTIPTLSKGIYQIQKVFINEN